MADDLSTKMDEYRTLRTEILQNDKLCQMFSVTAMVAVAAAFLFQGLHPSYAGIFVPCFLYLAYLQLLLHKYEGTIRIATYIATFLEPDLPGLGWERRIRSLKPRTAWVAVGDHLRSRFFSIELLLMLPVVFGTLGFVVAQKQQLESLGLILESDSVPGLGLAVILALFVFCFSLLQISRIHRLASPNGYLADWKKLKSEGHSE